MKFRIIVCRGPECGGRLHSAGLADAFAGELSSEGLSDQVEMDWQSCFGRCSQGPNVLVREVKPVEPAFALATMPGQRGLTALYHHVTLGDIPTIVREHIRFRRIVRDLANRR